MCRIYRKSDPSYQPHRYRDGYFRVYPRNAGAQRHHAKHARKIMGEDELGRLVETGQWITRFSREGRSPVGIIPGDTIVEWN